MIDCGAVFHWCDAANANAAWLNVVFSVVTSFPAAPLEALAAEDLNFRKPDSGGGAEPCLILYTRQMFLYVTGFSAVYTTLEMAVMLSESIQCFMCLF